MSVAKECRDHQGAKPRLRASKMGKWRALALLLVHAIVALHVAHWLQTGRTISPIEPSESMELSKRSLVNAGAIFFALTVASTLVFGRFFCGWACHVVALQDASRWLLLKLGVRPRAVYLGPLLVVPWAAFAYMFVAPFLFRWLDRQSLGPVSYELHTEAFFATFPDPRTWHGVVVIAATFFTCGFAIVYLLGSKAFCTHACPYGAIFGVADQLAPVRIRVTDACEGCGHCTATCTSNVNVRVEVRDYGMVVDPGCMKCLDCVSVCPKDALYVGFGAPAIAAKRRTAPSARSSAASTSDPSRKDARAPRAERRPELARFALLAAFLPCLFALFLAYDGTISAYWPSVSLTDPRILELIGLLTAGSLAVAWVFRGKGARRSDYTVFEEALLAGSFLLAMFAFRGLRNFVPFLFALGLSAVFAWCVVQALRLVASDEARMQRWTLKSAGRMTRVGLAFAVVFAIASVAWAAAAWHQIGQARAARDAVARSHADVDRSRELYNDGVRAANEARLADAVQAFEAASTLDPTFVEARENWAGMLCAMERFGEGLRVYETLIAEGRGDADTRARAGFAAMQVRDLKRARELLEESLRRDPARAEVAAWLAQVLDAEGSSQAAQELRARYRLR